jgi:hypothetical protein
MKVYKSKIGLELAVPIALTCSILAFLTIPNHSGWKWLFMISPLLSMIYLVTSTHYIIDGNRLIIKLGFLTYRTIDIQTILKISETNNPLSAPAASLDRLEINYTKNNTILISPKLKTEFIEQIRLLNPQVEVKLRNR